MKANIACRTFPLPKMFIVANHVPNMRPRGYTLDKGDLLIKNKFTLLELIVGVDVGFDFRGERDT